MTNVKLSSPAKFDRNLVLYEDSPKYDRWIKLALVFPVALLFVFGILFYVDATDREVFPEESEKDSMIASIVLFTEVPFILFIYWLVLPRKIYILQDKIKIRMGQFFLNVPFDTIKSVRAVKGVITWFTINAVTSYSRQVEIVRRKWLKIRISPTNRDQFLEYVNRAMFEWQRLEK